MFLVFLIAVIVIVIIKYDKKKTQRENYYKKDMPDTIFDYMGRPKTDAKSMNDPRFPPEFFDEAQRKYREQQERDFGVPGQDNREGFQYNQGQDNIYGSDIPTFTPPKPKPEEMPAVDPKNITVSDLSNGGIDTDAEYPAGRVSFPDNGSVPVINPESEHYGVGADKVSAADHAAAAVTPLAPRAHLDTGSVQVQPTAPEERSFYRPGKSGELMGTVDPYTETNVDVSNGGIEREPVRPASPSFPEKTSSVWESVKAHSAWGNTASTAPAPAAETRFTSPPVPSVPDIQEPAAMAETGFTVPDIPEPDFTVPSVADVSFTVPSVADVDFSVPSVADVSFGAGDIPKVQDVNGISFGTAQVQAVNTLDSAGISMPDISPAGGFASEMPELPKMPEMPDYSSSGSFDIKIPEMPTGSAFDSLDLKTQFPGLNDTNSDRFGFPTADNK